MAKIKISVKSSKNNKSTFFKSAIALKLTRAQKRQIMLAAKADNRTVNNFITTVLYMELMRPNSKILAEIKPIETADVLSLVHCSRRIKGTTNMSEKNKDYALTSMMVSVKDPALAEAVHTIALAKRRTRPQLIAEILMRAIKKFDTSNVKLDKRVSVASKLVVTSFTPEQLAMLPQNMVVTRSKFFAQKVKKNIGHITEKDIAKYKPARGSFKQTLMQNISETFAKKLDEYAKAFDVSVSDVLRACVLK